jgi:hypothetical protein
MIAWSPTVVYMYLILMFVCISEVETCGLRFVRAHLSCLFACILPFRCSQEIALPRDQEYRAVPDINVLQRQGLSA